MKWNRFWEQRGRLTKYIIIGVFIIIFESALLLLANYDSFYGIYQEADGDYNSLTIDDFSGYEMKDCTYEKDHFEVHTTEPYVILDDIKGYVDSITIYTDPAKTYCQYVTVYYDTGDGYNDKEKITDSLSTLKPNMIFDINEHVVGIKLCFEGINYKSDGWPTIVFERFDVNPVTIGMYQEQILNYIIYTSIAAIVTYIMLFSCVKLKESSLGNIVLFFAVTGILRVECGSGYGSLVSAKTKLIIMLLNCTIAGVLVLIAGRKSKSYEKN